MLIKIWVTFLGVAVAVLFTIAAVGGLLSGWVNWRDGFRRGIVDFIIGICEFIILEPIAIVCILGVIGLYH